MEKLTFITFCVGLKLFIENFNHVQVCIPGGKIPQSSRRRSCFLFDNFSSTFWVLYFCVFLFGCLSAVPVWQMGCHLVEVDDEKDLQGLSFSNLVVTLKLYSEILSCVLSQRRQRRGWANLKPKRCSTPTKTSITALQNQTGFYFAFHVFVSSSITGCQHFSHPTFWIDLTPNFLFIKSCSYRC